MEDFVNDVCFKYIKGVTITTLILQILFWVFGGVAFHSIGWGIWLAFLIIIEKKYKTVGEDYDD